MEIKFAHNLPFGRKDEAEDTMTALERARQSRNPFVQPVAPTARQIRRARRRNSEAFSRKSRRRGFQNRRLQFDAEQNFRGQARVYFGLSNDATPAMCRNVEQAVERLAGMLSKRDGIPYGRALDQVEERMRDLLIQYGDIDESAEEVA